MFCKEIVHADIEKLKRTPCTNVFLGSRHLSARDPLYDGTRSVKEGNATQSENVKEGKKQEGTAVLSGERDRERKERREEGRVEGQEMHDHEIEVVIG